jgi:hypothetical protein
MPAAAREVAIHQEVALRRTASEAIQSNVICYWRLLECGYHSTMLPRVLQCQVLCTAEAQFANP